MLSHFAAAPVVMGMQPGSEDTDRMTADTVGRMAQLVRIGRGHQLVQHAATDAVRHCGAGDRETLARAVFGWVKRKLTFLHDEDVMPEAGEMLIAPWILLGMPQPAGDCDDYTTLTCSMLAALDVPMEIVTIAAERENPERYSHVFCQVKLEDGTRLPLDTSHGEEPGWEAPVQYRRQAWPLFLEMAQSAPARSGLHGFKRGYDPIEDQVLRGRATKSTVRRGVSGYAKAPGRQFKFNGFAGLGDDGTDGSGWDAGDWNQLASTIAIAGTRIYQTTQGQQPVGTYIRGADGSVYMRGNPNQPLNPGYLPSSSGSSNSTLLLLGGALLLFVVMGNK